MIPSDLEVLAYDDFVEAYLDGGIYWVNVADQTQNQLLFLAIEVY